MGAGKRVRIEVGRIGVRHRGVSPRQTAAENRGNVVASASISRTAGYLFLVTIRSCKAVKAARISSPAATTAGTFLPWSIGNR